MHIGKIRSCDWAVSGCSREKWARPRVCSAPGPRSMTHLLLSIEEGSVEPECHLRAPLLALGWWYVPTTAPRCWIAQFGSQGQWCHILVFLLDLGVIVLSVRYELAAKCDYWRKGHDAALAPPGCRRLDNLARRYSTCLRSTRQTHAKCPAQNLSHHVICELGKTALTRPWLWIGLPSSYSGYHMDIMMVRYNIW